MIGYIIIEILYFSNGLSLIFGLLGEWEMSFLNLPFITLIYAFALSTVTSIPAGEDATSLAFEG